jgi:hypothetical protein
MGPVQVLVVGFDHPAFSGEVLAELTRLRQAGIVRLVDLLLVARAEDGTLETLNAPELVDAGLGGLAVALLARPDGEAGTGTGDADPGDGQRPLGHVRVVPGRRGAGRLRGCRRLIEHLWAGPLTSAIRRAGGTPLDETWLAAGDLARLAAMIEHRAVDDLSMPQ